MLIGSVFGTVFVLANAHAPLAPAAGTALRVLALAALAGLVAITVLLGRRERAGVGGPAVVRADQYGRGFRLVVAGEAALLVIGNVTLRACGAPTQTYVGWVALVVGAHFLVLMAVWKQRSIAVPGVALTVLGAAGLAMAATPAVDWVPFVSGVLSGAVLLGGGTYGVAREYRATAGARSVRGEGARRPG